MASSIQIDFQAACSTESYADEITLELDGDQNSSSSFQVDESAYLRVYPAGHYSYTKTMNGNLSVLIQEKVHTLTQVVYFTGSETVSVTRPIKSVTSILWYGTPKKCESFDNASITLVQSGQRELSAKQCIWGAAKITYKTSYTSIKYIPRELGAHMIIARSSTAEDHEIVPCVIYESEDVTLRIVDACTGQAVENARVTVDGSYVGLTDSDGDIEVGVLEKGTHTLSVTASGYLDSDADNLDNETFVVEGEAGTL